MTEGEPSIEELSARLAAVQAENERRIRSALLPLPKAEGGE